MNYLVLLGCMALLVGFVLYVGYPLFISRQRQQVRASEGQGKHLEERKEQLYAAIKELEVDLDQGKLSASDYQYLRRELEAEALELIQQLDQLNGHVSAGSLRERIDADVLELRQSEAEANDRCMACGADRRAKDQFCPQCGARFK